MLNTPVLVQFLNCSAWFSDFYPYRNVFLNLTYSLFSKTLTYIPIFLLPGVLLPNIGHADL